MKSHGTLSAINTLKGTSQPNHIPVSLLIKKTLFVALPFLIVACVAIGVYYKQQATTVDENALGLNSYTNRTIYLTLQQILRNIKGDAHLLASHPYLPKVLDNPQGDEALQLVAQWQSFAAQKRLYDQLRLLDLQGKEILRINLTEKSALSVPQDQLQDKSGRYYFRQAMSLPVGEFYLSPLDLNIENKQIEQPIKPMLRVCLSVTDSLGKKAGLIVLNYLASNIMDEIETHSVLADSKSMLLNQQSYYLHGLDERQEWLFMYPHRDQRIGKFSVQYPEIWRFINSVENNQLVTDQGIFNYQWLSTDMDETTASPYTRRFALITMISAKQLEILKAPYRNGAWATLLLVIPTILIIAAIASRFRLKELSTFEQLREIESNQSLILESVGEGIFGLDAQGLLTFANSRAEDLIGYQKNEMLGRSLHNILHTCSKLRADHTIDQCPIQQSLEQGISRQEDNDIFLRRNCDTFPVEYISNPIIRNGKSHGGVVSFFDISARKKAEEQAEYLALNDALTDLPNKKLFLDRLDQHLTAAKKNGLMAALLYIDIDRFKQINDALGHDCGDNILKEIAYRVKSVTQETDTLARIGSDEFVLLHAADAVDAERMAQNAQLAADEIMLALEQPYYVDNNSIRITASIGIAIFPVTDKDAATVLAQADTAVANAKQAGRHTTRFFEASMERTTKDWLQIHNRMLEALALNTFTLVYQPKVEQNGKIIGLEALLRWHDKILGQVSPSDFVPIAEQSGLIKQLSEFVLTSACQQLKHWQDSGLANSFEHVAINISAVQFSDKDFVKYILEYIENAGVDAHNIEFEITERTLVDNITATHKKIHALRKRGVRFSIDDFGTGYSSLAYLQQLPLDRLKIDRTFVTGVDKEPNRQAIVEAIILLAKGLSIKVIAEGVETAEELEYLLEAGCSEFQGNRFYYPMSAEQLTDILSQRMRSANQTYLH